MGEAKGRESLSGEPLQGKRIGKHQCHQYGSIASGGRGVRSLTSASQQQLASQAPAVTSQVHVQSNRVHGLRRGILKLKKWHNKRAAYNHPRSRGRALQRRLLSRTRYQGGRPPGTACLRLIQVQACAPWGNGEGRRRRGHAGPRDVEERHRLRPPDACNRHDDSQSSAHIARAP